MELDLHFQTCLHVMALTKHKDSLFLPLPLSRTLVFCYTLYTVSLLTNRTIDSLPPSSEIHPVMHRPGSRSKWINISSSVLCPHTPNTSFHLSLSTLHLRGSWSFGDSLTFNISDWLPTRRTNREFCLRKCLLLIMEMIWNRNNLCGHNWLTVELSTTREATVVQPLSSFPAFYGTWRFITAYTTALHLYISWARPIQSTTFNPVCKSPS
jgi:hypothetical protein